MSEEASFESLMRAGTGRGTERLRAGDTIEVTVLQVTGEWVFVDAGTPSDGRIGRAELEENGKLRVAVGDSLRATVVDPRPDGPLLAVSLGRGGTTVDGALELSLASGAPVEAEVTRAVKGGLEVTVGGTRGFCPASQVDIGHVPDLNVYVGQRLEFRVLEIKEGGRNVILSRRALLEDRRREAAEKARGRLIVGEDVDGVVQALGKHGAVVDLEGVEGFIHISELAPHRVERVEDVVSPGERVRARILSVEDSPRGGLRVRLSLRVLAAAMTEANAAAPDEVLSASVVRATANGILVQTPRGQGLVPLRELGLAPGADHRRAFPAGKQLKVVLVRNAGGRLTFSVTEVDRVEERRHYRDFTSAGAASPKPSSALGSLGDVLREKLARR